MTLFGATAYNAYSVFSYNYLTTTLLVLPITLLHQGYLIWCRLIIVGSYVHFFSGNYHIEPKHVLICMYVRAYVRMCACIHTRTHNTCHKYTNTCMFAFAQSQNCPPLTTETHCDAVGFYPNKSLMYVCY